MENKNEKKGTNSDSTGGKDAHGRRCKNMAKNQDGKKQLKKNEKNEMYCRLKIVYCKTNPDWFCVREVASTRVGSNNSVSNSVSNSDSSASGKGRYFQDTVQTVKKQKGHFLGKFCFCFVS